MPRFWTAVCSSITCVFAVTSSAGEVAPKTIYFTNPGPEQEHYFAIAVRAPHTPSRVQALDVAIIMDSSADQSAKGWRNGVQWIEALLEELQGGSRAQIATSVQPGRPLSGEPAAVGSESLATAVRKLRETAPLGTVQLADTYHSIERWLDDVSGSLPKAVVLLGNFSTVRDVPTQIQERLAKRLVQAHSPLHWVLTDPSPANDAVAALVARSGGRFYLPQPTVAEQFQETLQGLMSPVLYDARVTMPGDAQLVLPTQLPPLRSDVATLIAGRAVGPKFDFITLSGLRNGQRVEHRIELGKPEGHGHSYLAGLIKRWEQQPDMPSLYPADVALAAAQISSALQTEQVLAQANAALARRQTDKAQELYRWVAQVEPTNPEAHVGLQTVQKLADQPASEANQPTPRKSAEAPEVLEDAKVRQRIEAQRLHREVSEAIRQARRLARTSYEDAIRLLKQTMAAVETSPILDQEQIVGMVRRLESELRTLWRERQRAELDQLERDRVLAQVANRQRAEQERYIRELTTKELMSRYHAVLEQGDYASAQATAFQMRNENPDEVATAAAQLRADLTTSYAINEDLQHRVNANSIAALQLSQNSAIPMPDEPPIIYPPAKVWEELTIRRQKYNVIDLAPVSPAEEKVRQSLTRPVSFDFQETPLSDVVDFLREYTGVNIVLDSNGLDEVQIDADTPVTLRLQQVTLKSALNLLLSQFELTYMVQDEVLLITSDRRASEEMVTKVYPVADLVIPIIDFNSGGVGLNGALGGGNAGQGGLGGGGFGGFGGGGGGNFGGAGGGAAGGGFGNAGGGGAGNLTGGGNQAVGNDISQELIELIQRVIEPDSWDSAGGPGSIREFNHNLVVRNNQKTQQKVANATDALRGKSPKAARATPPSASEWDAYFAEHTVPEQTLQRILTAFGKAGMHKQAMFVILSALRHQQVGDWVYEPLALSMQIIGAPASDVEQALLSRIQRTPSRLDVRLSVAESLASLGSTKRAIELLKESAALFPMSANLYFMALDLSETAVDVDTMAWATDQLLKREWPKQSDQVHRQTQRKVQSLVSRLRQQGQDRDAARLQAVAKEVQHRDIEVTARWAGDADVDLYVVEPGDLLCGPATPQTVNGGIMVSDGVGNHERYVCGQAFAGDYDLIVRPVWGTPAGEIVSIDVVLNKGSEQEQRMRHTVKLRDNAPITIHLENGRRTEQTAVVLQEEFLFAENHGQEKTGRVPPMVQLRQMIETGQIRPPADPDPQVVIGASPRPLAQLVVAAQRPFVTGGTAVASGGAVAFDPTITLVNDGTTLTAQAVVSADRRFVRMQLVPVFQQITGVSTTTIIGTAGGGGGGQ